jgi:hypothetical protein
MNSISKVLSQLPDLEITKEEFDIQKLEIEFRTPSERWVTILENLTKDLPYLYFVKRYLSIGGEFGFRWLILGFGVQEEQLDDIAQQLRFVIFEKQYKPKATIKTSSTVNKPTPLVTTIPIEKGEQVNFPIPHITGELNTPGPKGKGAYPIKPPN